MRSNSLFSSEFAFVGLSESPYTRKGTPVPLLHEDFPDVLIRVRTDRRLLVLVDEIEEGVDHLWELLRRTE